MTNLAFGGHFGVSPPTYLAHVEEMEVLWIMSQEVLLDISRKIHLSTFFSRLNWTISCIPYFCIYPSPKPFM